MYVLFVQCETDTYITLTWMKNVHDHALNYISQYLYTYIKNIQIYVENIEKLKIWMGNM